jgi:hypothetical protein
VARPAQSPTRDDHRGADADDRAGPLRQRPRRHPPPAVEAPVATFSGEPGGGPGFCSLFGYTAAFDANRLSSLSPTHQDYVKTFSKATDKLQRDGS